MAKKNKSRPTFTNRGSRVKRGEAGTKLPAKKRGEYQAINGRRAPAIEKEDDS